MPKYVITSENNAQIFHDAVNIGSASTYTFDFAPWAEDNNTVTSVTWTLKSGQGTITAETLVQDSASALITFDNQDKTLIEIKADTGTEIYTTFLSILIRDQEHEFLEHHNDYGHY